MAIPVLIIGKSGSGKSASLRNFDPKKIHVINVMGKPFPFKSAIVSAKTADYGKINEVLLRIQRDVLVIDDAGYLITNHFMSNHSSAGSGNGVFALYNQIGDNFWSLIRAIQRVPGDRRVYVIMHEDKNDLGDVKPKTIGKLLDEKVCVEGMFTICLRCAIRDGKHVFITQSDGFDVAKSPMGMFDSVEIDNDLAMVDAKICEYYEIKPNQNEQKQEKTEEKSA